MAESPQTRDLGSVIGVFAPLGWRAIGGPAAHVALMEREVVQKRHWLDRGEFGRLFAACNLMPGPGSTQLALMLGLRRAGIAGMLVTALLFIGPAVLLMLGLGELYRDVGANHQVQLVLLGMDAAVVAIVARAAVALAALGRRGVVGTVIACAALIAGVVGVTPLLVLACGGALAFGAWAVPSARSSASRRRGSATAWFAAVHLPAATAGLIPIGLTFLKIGAVAFGSGYVLLPLLHADFVGGSFHLTERQVADAFAISQVTPGPVFAVAAFLGVQLAGIPGGIVAAVAIFAPSLVFAPLVSVVMRVTETHPGLRASLDGVVNAAVGLIASACVTLARASFVSPLAIAIAVVVFLVLWRWPRAQPVAVLIGMAGGLVIMLTAS